LTSIINVEVDYKALEEKAEQIETITSKLKEIEAPISPKKEDLGYIG